MKTFFSKSLQLIALAGLLLLPTGWAQAGPTTRVSVDSAGVQAAGYSSDRSSVSTDGRYVAFVSVASLVPEDTNGPFVNDIFVHDRQTGSTSRVSVNSAGEQANSNSNSYQPSISADGRYVAFTSDASNLVAGDMNSTEIFVHDRETGTTSRVSVDSTGRQADAGNRHDPHFSIDPSISADGRYVAFTSNSSNLVAGDTNGVGDIFVHDRQTGSTSRVNVDSASGQGDGYYGSGTPSLSADGRYVAFYSDASNLVAGDTNGTVDVFVHDRQTGSTSRVSVDSAGGQANGGSGYSLSISADGRFVAFISWASNLVAGDTNGVDDIFVHDRQTGSTSRVSVDSAGGQANYGSFSFSSPSLSADGRYVAFESIATNLVVGDTNGNSDIFVHDRQTGTTSRASVDSAGGQANKFGYTYPFGSHYPSLSADGRYVAFNSSASDLVAGDTNGSVDIFVHQLPCELDADCDGIPDSLDNCLYVPNGPLAPDVGGHSQRDTNGDGIGNACDADLNNDGRVTAADYAILRSRLNTADPDADLDGDSLVTLKDYQILRYQLSQAPGPSGLVP